MSTALWMLEDGSYDVTILDRSETLPAPDAASTDLNKVSYVMVVVNRLIVRSFVRQIMQTPIWPVWHCKLWKCGESQSGKGRTTSEPARRFTPLRCVDCDLSLIDVRSGVMCLSSKSNPESHAFVFAAYSNCRALGLQSDLTPTLEKIQEVLGDVPIGLSVSAVSRLTLTRGRLWRS